MAAARSGSSTWSTSGYLGEKTGGSFFREKRTLVIDPATLEYRPWQDPRQPSLAEANKISDPVARVKKFISFDDAAARFGWDLLAATFVYSANRIPEICADIAADRPGACAGATPGTSVPSSSGTPWASRRPSSA